MKPLCFALFVAACLLTGCNSSPATISGQVSYEGQPIADGYITFTPANGKGPESGAPIVGGRYSVARITPGPKLVKVIGTRKVSFASTSEEMKNKSAQARKSGNFDGLVDPADAVPENAAGNNQQIDVAPGDNQRDFKLQKPDSKP